MLVLGNINSSALIVGTSAYCRSVTVLLVRLEQVGKQIGMRIYNEGRLGITTVCVVLAFIVPAAYETKVFYESLRLRDNWPSQEVEIKGRSLNECGMQGLAYFSGRSTFPRTPAPSPFQLAKEMSNW